MDPKQTLIESLQAGRDAMLWKLDGLSEYDARRPMTPTGTNLLGLVKHLASIEIGYFGETFGRPSDIELPWYADDADPNDDLYATARGVAGSRSSTSTGRPGPTPPRPSRRSTWTPRDGCRGGARTATRSPCTRSWCTWSPRRTGTPATPTSSARPIDGQAGRRPEDPSLDGDYDFAPTGQGRGGARRAPRAETTALRRPRLRT